MLILCVTLAFLLLVSRLYSVFYDILDGRKQSICLMSNLQVFLELKYLDLHYLLFESALL